MGLARRGWPCSGLGRGRGWHPFARCPNRRGRECRVAARRSWFRGGEYSPGCCSGREQAAMYTLMRGNGGSYLYAGRSAAQAADLVF